MVKFHEQNLTLSDQFVRIYNNNLSLLWDSANFSDILHDNTQSFPNHNLNPMNNIYLKFFLFHFVYTQMLHRVYLNIKVPLEMFGLMMIS